MQLGGHFFYEFLGRVAEPLERASQALPSTANDYRENELCFGRGWCEVKISCEF